MKLQIRSILYVLMFSFLTAVVVSATMPASQAVNPTVQVAPNVAKGTSGQMTMLIAEEIRHRLIMLPYYGVFDWLECEITSNNAAVLRGQVNRPSTKSDAEAELRKIEGITGIQNQIEVLPISPTDDQIRIAVYRSMFKYEGPLFRYAIQAVPPIHIVVNNGRVALKGFVDNAADKQLASVAANGVSGVFEVRNELAVQNAKDLR